MLLQETNNTVQGERVEADQPTEQREIVVPPNEVQEREGQNDNGVDQIIAKQERVVKKLPTLNEFLDQPSPQEEVLLQAEPPQQNGQRRYQRSCCPNRQIFNDDFLHARDKEGHVALLFHENSNFNSFQQAMAVLESK